MKILRSKLYEAEQARPERRDSCHRRSQVGTGDRSGKIRTYNFPQNRVTDHRLTGDSKNFNLAAVINGDLDALIDALTLADQTRRLQEGYEKGRMSHGCKHEEAVRQGWSAGGEGAGKAPLRGPTTSPRRQRLWRKWWS